MTVYSISHSTRYREKGDTLITHNLNIPEGISAAKYLEKDLSDKQKPALVRLLLKEGATYINADTCGAARSVPGQFMTYIPTGKVFSWAFFRENKMATVLGAYRPEAADGKIDVDAYDCRGETPEKMFKLDAVRLFREMELTDNGRAVMNAKHFPLDPGI